ncbi:hypothetical protein F5Y07DRAFT_283892 [Xylaria sp. FL0933]|nr:hypothetical protein F5Y07DRAFT_283892 [Xylaria sp. FL0933]
MLFSSFPRAVFLLVQLLAPTFTTTRAAATIFDKYVTSKAAIHDDYDYSSLSCPSSSLSTLTTPTYGTSGAVFTICSSININATATIIRDAVLDFKSYSLWNSFVVSVSVPSNVTRTPQDLYVGMPMVFTTSGLIPGLNTTSDEVLTTVNGTGVGGDGKPYFLVSWRYNDKLGGIAERAEHPVVIVDLGDGSSRVLSYETYYVGLATLPIAFLKNNLEKRFDAQAVDLKNYVEAHRP